jgi:hypothetical protein
MISVIIPVGPNANRLWLKQCLDSIYEQTLPYFEAVVVDDGAGIKDTIWRGRTTYRPNPWRLGQAASLNIGISQAKYDLIFTMGGYDDTLRPACLYECIEEWFNRGNDWGLYHPTIITSEGEIGTLAQGVCFFERKVWASIGGYPPEAGVGEVDAIFQSMLLGRGNTPFYPVKEGEPLYWHREHPDSLTALKTFERRDLCKKAQALCTKEYAKETPDWVQKVYDY